MRIQPFRITIEQSAIDELKRRVRETRWPVALSDAGWALGMDAGFLRTLGEHWLSDFDWRAVEEALNQTPQFRATSDTGSIHFAHIRSAAVDAMPVVLTHGWPSTFAELMTLGDMLANPARHGAQARDSFHVVIPSLPGFAFSSPPTALGTNVFTIADQWSELMSALGYSRFLTQGGDLGAGVSTALGLEHGERLFGVHLNFIPGSYQPHPGEKAALSEEETAWMAARAAWIDSEGGYSHVQATKPDVLGPALNDSPLGLAAWIVDKFRSWSDCNGDVETRFSMDELLTTVSLYWFTQSMPSAIRLYWEGRRRPLAFAPDQRVRVPVGVAHFPKELPLPPRSWVERGYNVTRWTPMPKGGHFAPFEEPAALAAEIRAFARSLREGSGTRGA